MNAAKINGWLTVGNCHSCPEDGYELVIHIFRTDTRDKQERCCVHKEGVDHLRMNYQDGHELDPSNLANLDAVVAKLRERKRLTKIHCHAGFVRSPTVAIYLLTFVDGMHPYDAHDLVTKAIYNQRDRTISRIYYEPWKQIVKLWEARGGQSTPKAVSLFQRIEEIINHPNGWCTWVKAKALAGIVLALRPQVVVEIGVWSGKSLLPMALAVKEVGVGRVIGIDPYQTEASAAGQTAANAEWWSKTADHEAMFQLCSAYLKTYGVDGCTELWRLRSDECQVPAGIGLLHIDGNHSDQAIEDVKRYCEAVVPGGFVVMDDLHWEGGAVERAVGWLLGNGFRELYRVVGEGNDWGVFQK